MLVVLCGVDGDEINLFTLSPKISLSDLLMAIAYIDSINSTFS